MALDFCSRVRDRLGKGLSTLGLEECGCRSFGDGVTGHGAMFATDVAYYQGHGFLVAICYSAGDGEGCFIGNRGDDPMRYNEWPSLWEMVGMTKGLLTREEAASDPDADLAAWAAYFDQFPPLFPSNLDAMIDFIGVKLAELIRR